MIEAARLRRFAATVPVPQVKTNEYRWILILGLIHIPLGILIYNAPALGVIHQLTIFLFAFYSALQKQIKLERIALIVAYIVGAEVLWRMANVSLFWELGKYGSSLIFVVALLRKRRRRLPLVPSLYFLALLPACLKTLNDQDPDTARHILSSGMSGPLLLAVSCVFFSNVEVTKVTVPRIITSLLLPLVSVAFVTFFYTISTPEIEFNGESNFATSGGFGPNQVSSMLGAGAFAALLLLIIYPNTQKEKLLLAIVALFMTAQSVMTFSRGGIYNAVGAIIAAGLVVFFREPGNAVRRFAPIVLALVIFLGLVFPAMDSMTAGSLSERFEDTSGSNRAEIVEADFGIFFENPVFGAGVGGAYTLREQYLDRKAMSHTEFTRLLSEHGVFGAVALLMLLIIAVTNIRRQSTTLGKAFVVGVAVWATLFMVNAGMRLAAPSFMWGLTFLTIGNTRFLLRRPNRMRFPKEVRMPQRA